MNDHIRLLLQAHLDGAIAALPAFTRRKQRVREEMAAHLFSIYEDEFARLHDEKQALAAAIHRFGAADVLHDELKTCVPILERILHPILGTKENVMRWLFTILGCVAFLVGLGFVFPAVQQMLFQEIIPLSVVLLTLGCAVSLAGAWSVVHGIKRFRMGNS